MCVSLLALITPLSSSPPVPTITNAAFVTRNTNLPLRAWPARGSQWSLDASVTLKTKFPLLSLWSSRSQITLRPLRSRQPKLSFISLQAYGSLDSLGPHFPRGAPLSIISPFSFKPCWANATCK